MTRVVKSNYFFQKLFHLTFLISILTFSISFKGFSQNYSFKECIELTSQINAVYGNTAVDRVTTFRNASCFPPAKLTYYYIYDTNKMKTLNVKMEEILKLAKSINIKRFCTNKIQREILFSFDDIEFNYEDKVGNYLGKYKLNKFDC